MLNFNRDPEQTISAPCDTKLLIRVSSGPIVLDALSAELTAGSLVYCPTKISPGFEAEVGFKAAKKDPAAGKVTADLALVETCTPTVHFTKLVISFTAESITAAEVSIDGKSVLSGSGTFLALKHLIDLTISGSVITISDRGVPPTLLGISGARRFRIGRALSGVKVELESYTPDDPVTFSCDPPAPAGIELNAQSGEIKGAGKFPGFSQHKITVKNSAGSVSMDFPIEFYLGYEDEQALLKRCENSMRPKLDEEGLAAGLSILQREVGCKPDLFRRLKFQLLQRYSAIFSESRKAEQVSPRKETFRPPKGQPVVSLVFPFH